MGANRSLFIKKAKIRELLNFRSWSLILSSVLGSWSLILGPSP